MYDGDLRAGVTTGRGYCRRPPISAFNLGCNRQPSSDVRFRGSRVLSATGWSEVPSIRSPRSSTSGHHSVSGRSDVGRRRTALRRLRHCDGPRVDDAGRRSGVEGGMQDRHARIVILQARPPGLRSAGPPLVPRQRLRDVGRTVETHTALCQGSGSVGGSAALDAYLP